MTYINSISLFLDRLAKKHKEKGESFRGMSIGELNNILIDEYQEYWEATIVSEEIEELTDVMVSCAIIIEKLLMHGGDKQ